MKFSSFDWFSHVLVFNYAKNSDYTNYPETTVTT